MSLPDAIERYAERALAEAPPAAEAVRLTQEGAMWMKPGGRPKRFTASEHLEVGRVAFSWRARFSVAGPIAFSVVDGYDKGHGLLELRVFGVRVQRREGPHLALGEGLRYLAELPWAPHALYSNPQLEWRELDAGRVEVSAQLGEERGAVTFDFDPAGDIVRASAVRPRAGGSPAAWGAAFGEYGVLGGIRMPAAAEVYWDLDGDRFVYWKGKVLSASPR